MYRLNECCSGTRNGKTEEELYLDPTRDLSREKNIIKVVDEVGNVYVESELDRKMTVHVKLLPC